MSEPKDDIKAEDVNEATPEGAELSLEQLDAVQGGTQALSSISKTRSEVSMTFARNMRG